MALVKSNSFGLGTKAHDFILVNTLNHKEVRLELFKGNIGTVVMFICNHCPFVLHINSELVSMANTYIKKGIHFIAISSNDAKAYPQDGPSRMKEVAQKLHYPFPYLYDEDQKVAKAYKAACTPDIYLFNSNLKSVYHGQIDDSRPGNDIPVTGKDLRHAMDLLIKNQPNHSVQKPSIGCNIKWK